MGHQQQRNEILCVDERRDMVIPGGVNESLTFAAEHFIKIATSSMKNHGHFSVALSGGQTPNALIKMLSSSLYREQIDWSKVICFWSDERSVSPDHPDSNYHMAMQSGLASLPISQHTLFRMKAEDSIEDNALKYEELIRKHVLSHQFDLVMLGMGEDGHTASLFPDTQGLHTENRLVVANFIPQKDTWRMTFTFDCINSAKNICIYVLGGKKANKVLEVFSTPYDPNHLPIQKIGTENHKALWILDDEAGQEILSYLIPKG